MPEKMTVEIDSSLIFWMLKLGGDKRFFEQKNALTYSL